MKAAELRSETNMQDLEKIYAEIEKARKKEETSVMLNKEDFKRMKVHWGFVVPDEVMRKLKKDGFKAVNRWEADLWNPSASWSTLYISW